MVVMSVSTKDFIGNWSIGKNSFMVDAPNAVCVADELKGKQDIVIIELFNPVYDSDTNKIKYDIISDNNTLLDIPNPFGQTTIIIDTTNTLEPCFPIPGDNDISCTDL